MSAFSAMFAADDVRTIARQACRIAALEAEVADLRRQLQPQAAPQPKPAPKPAPKAQPQPQDEPTRFTVGHVAHFPGGMFRKRVEVVKRTAKMVFFKISFPDTVEPPVTYGQKIKLRADTCHGPEIHEHTCNGAHRALYASQFEAPKPETEPEQQQEPEEEPEQQQEPEEEPEQQQEQQQEPQPVPPSPAETLTDNAAPSVVLKPGEFYGMEAGGVVWFARVTLRRHGFVRLEDFRGNSFLKKVRVSDPLPEGDKRRGEWRSEWVDFTGDRSLPDYMPRAVCRAVTRASEYTWRMRRFSEGRSSTPYHWRQH